LNEVKADWQPTCSLGLLRLRAQTLQKIRQFFADRAVLEVETPLLGGAIGTDPQLDFFTTAYHWSPSQRTLFLQTSPEFAMKRLLAAGSGSIYQICKAFRNGESGRFHNPEFTLLEWYRVGYNLSQLMDEVDELIALLFECKVLQPTQRVSYQSLFQQTTGLNPLVFSYQEYSAYAQDSGLAEAVSICGRDHTMWLDFIFSHQIQPYIGNNKLCMVYGYPACMPSLARINEDNAAITDRVELFINGVELGNGYFELSDAKEQEQRFDREIAARENTQRPVVTKDERLLAALGVGLPNCSGIAIGLDRILMLLSKSPAIDDVLAFSISKA
jgi:elongation factor P--(R)-beta-lysine ligase